MVNVVLVTAGQCCEVSYLKMLGSLNQFKREIANLFETDSRPEIL